MKKISKDQFIEESKLKHGNKYRYNNNINFINLKSIITIECLIHGEFKQRASDHRSGCGCPTCAEQVRKDKKKDTLLSVIDKANLRHDNKYAYSTSTPYINNKSFLKITCPIHGEFTQNANNHLSGQGCQQCHSITTIKFKEAAIAVHGDLYDYSKSKYIKSTSKLVITCSIHGDFTQTPQNHISCKCGCPMCAKTGFDKTKPGILYYLKLNGGQYYKIGITNLDVKKRFTKDELSIIEVLATRYYEVGQDAYDAEQQVLEDYKEFKCIGLNILKSGNTELFSRDILDIDPMHLNK